MIRRYMLPMLALAGFGFGVYTVIAGQREVPVSKPIAQPAKAPFENFVAGSGLIEASSENIMVGAVVPGVVMEVLVTVGSRVHQGDPLFKLDDRQLQGELAVKQTALKVAREQLTRMKSLPRPEDIPAAEARVREAEASLADMKNQLQMRQSVTDKRAISEQELRQAGFAVDAGEAKLGEAKSQLALLKAGAWKADVAVSEAQVASAEAQMAAVQTEIDRLVVRAPIDGEVLQVKIRAGEYAQVGPLSTPLMLLGNVDTLHIRVDVDENDAWRVQSGKSAVAFARGNRDIQTALEFVRFEPYVVPKKSLTGDSGERVDTRVLQVVYRFTRGELPLYVGQQMDVFIDALPLKIDTESTVARKGA